MPAQIIAQSNPPAEPSLISDSILESTVQLKTKDFLTPDELKAVQAFRRAADYIAAGTFYN